MIAFAYYLLKVTVCSGVLFLYYHIALRNKLFHQWNRFYLLGSILISLVAPVIQISITHSASEEPNKAIQVLQVFQSADGYLEEVTIRGHRGISVDQWLGLIYGAISGILFLYVVLSIKKILSIIRSHSVQLLEKIRFINTRVQGTPFSFFNFIFWNEQIDLQTETGKQIFQHELVHVNEKHTLDKITVQLVLVAFWCNPFFWLIRRELKLIHEFIADKKSVGEHGTAALAAMILNSVYPAQFSITNQFFQTSIKRRLMMLKKIQNPRLNYVSRILALSILLVTVLAFTLRTRDSVASNTTLDKQVTVVIDAGHGIMPNGKPNGIAIGNAIEDGIVLAIAKKIQELNTNDKLKIVLSRTSDKIIDLHTRVDIAKENKADLFVSLHTNAFAENASPDLNADQSLKSGFCIYVSNGHPLYQQQSEKLGSAMQQQLNSIYPTNANLLKRNVGIWVLDQNVCPSVLIECGYLTDKKDREFITQDKNQTAVAQNILRAVEQYALSQQENGNTSLNLMINHDLAVAAGHRPANPGTQKDRINVNTRDTTKELPIFIVDGKEVSKEDAYKIDPNTIQSINISKDATEKYGKRGQGGVVEIKLKEHKSASDITFEQNGKIMATGTIKIDPSTNSFEANLKAVNHQQNDSIPNGQPIFTKVETEASVNKEEWSTFLRKNLQSVIELGAICGMKPGTYTVQLRFIVKQDGSLSEIEALNDPGYELAEKTVAFMKESPKWNPGLQNGRPVNSYHTQPITFVIQEQ